MGLYRLEIGVETCWVTAHDEAGAVDLAIAHVRAEPGIDEAALTQLVRDKDNGIVLEATAGQLIRSPRPNA